MSKAYCSCSCFVHSLNKVLYCTLKKKKVEKTIALLKLKFMTSCREFYFFYYKHSRTKKEHILSLIKRTYENVKYKFLRKLINTAVQWSMDGYKGRITVGYICVCCRKVW